MRNPTKMTQEDALRYAIGLLTEHVKAGGSDKSLVALDVLSKLEHTMLRRRVERQMFRRLACRKPLTSICGFAPPPIAWRARPYK